MKTIPLIVMLILCGCGTYRPKAYVGLQNVSSYDHAPDRDSAGAYVNILFPLGNYWSFQVEPIVPLNEPDKPLLRIGFDYEFGHHIFGK